MCDCENVLRLEGPNVDVYTDEDKIPIDDLELSICLKCRKVSDCNGEIDKLFLKRKLSKKIKSKPELRTPVDKEEEYD